MTWLPIVERELRVRARRASTYWGRVLVAAASIVLAVGFLLMEAISSGGRGGPGAMLFGMVSSLGMLVCGGAGIFLTADALSGERREGTLGFLFLTDLRGVDIVLGKLVATSMSACSGLLALLPVFAVTLTMGGVSGGEFFRMGVVLGMTLLFSLSAGLCVSSRCRDDGRAMAMTGGVILGLGVGLLVVDGVLRAGGAVETVPGWLSPIRFWLSAMDSTYLLWPGQYWRCLAGVTVVTLGFLGLASWWLPRHWQEGGRVRATPPPLPGERRVISGPGVEGGGRREAEERPAAVRVAWARRPLLDENPVYWLVSRRSTLAFPILMTVLIGSLGLVLLLSPGDDFLMMVGMLGTMGLGLLVRVSLAVQSARAMGALRESALLELVMTTPVAVSEVLGGLWRHLRRQYTAPVVAWCGLQLAWFLGMGGMRGGGSVWGAEFMGPVLLSGYLVVTFVGDCFLAAWVGMLLGLTARKPSRAPGLTVLYVVVLPWFVGCLPRVLATIPVGFWARDRVMRTLRGLGEGR